MFVGRYKEWEDGRNKGWRLKEWWLADGRNRGWKKEEIGVGRWNGRMQEIGE